MRHPCIERLESRQLFSAAPSVPMIDDTATQHALVISSNLAHASHQRKSPKQTAPFQSQDDFGGNYVFGASNGNTEVLIQSVRGKNISGLIEFSGYDGSDEIDSFKGVWAGRNNAFTFAVKTKSTSFTGKATYHPESYNPAIEVYIPGGAKFEGHKLSKYLPGEIFVMQGLNTINSVFG